MQVDTDAVGKPTSPLAPISAELEGLHNPLVLSSSYLTVDLFSTDADLIVIQYIIIQPGKLINYTTK